MNKKEKITPDIIWEMIRSFNPNAGNYKEVVEFLAKYAKEIEPKD